MNVVAWDTRQPIDEGFAGRWAEALAASPQSNFSMDRRYLEWEAKHGRHALALAVEDGPRRAVMVLRRVGGDWVSGYPWRWQGALLGPPGTEALFPSADTCAWFFRIANQAAGGARLRLFLPSPPPRGVPGFRLGSTILVDLTRTPEQLLADMGGDKRRSANKAAREGWVVSRAETPEQFRAFFALQQEANTWRKERESATGTPEPGESWREWELPWMTLLVASREGTVGAGSGFSQVSGGMIDYRANASNAEARKLGCNAQLAYEAMLRGRAQGCRIMNWGGSTEFKARMGGERRDLHCWLGGGAAWALGNHVEAGLHGARYRVASWAKALRRREAPES